MSFRKFLLIAFVLIFALAAVAGVPPPPEADQLPAPPSLPELKGHLAGLKQQLADGNVPADAQNLALLRLKLEQAGLAADLLDNQTALYPLQAQRYMAAVLSDAEQAAHFHGDAAFAAGNQMHERAYIAASDNSTQPYWVFLPKDYSARHSYPLVVFLHGYDPNITKINPWVPSSETWSLFTKRGFILAIPYGRRNSDFVNIGEDDTLAVTNEVEHFYSIDPQRVYLMGASMGGYGVYAVGLHHPDIWAAMAPMSARSDMYLWFKLQRDQVLPWKRIEYDADDPRTLKLNALHIPIFIQHGAQDAIVDVANARLFDADLRALNYAVKYREIPDADHYIYWQPETYDLALDWMSSVHHARPPSRVAFTTGTLENHRAYWVDITSFLDYSRTGQIQAQINADNVIAVQADNIGSFRLDPPASRLETGKPVTLVVNGVADGRTWMAGQPIEWTDPSLNALPTTAAPESFPGVKSPLRPGQIKNCYRDPFLLVYGTAGPKDESGFNTVPMTVDEACARRFQSEWQRFADGLPPIKADKDVTEGDKRNYNLILFGTRQSNSVLGEIAGKLPLELTPTGYRIGDRQVAGTGLGLQLCYPSPFDSKRMLVVQSGLYWGDPLPINHKFDLLPDYIVYDSTLDETDKTNHALAAGYFDGNWRLTADSGESTAQAPGALTAAR